MSEKKGFSLGEEIANAITHGIGAALSVAGLVLLIVFSSIEGNPLQIVSFTIFGVCMLLLYLSSTLYHSFKKGKTKRVFEIFDHSSIYLFIAGTYTPITLLAVEGSFGWIIFGVIWGLTVFGVLFKVFFINKFNKICTLIYILMGWLIVIAWPQITTNIPSEGITLLVAGGIAYTVGAVFYLWKGFKYHHAIWHLFVLAGSILHFFCILLYIK